MKAWLRNRIERVRGDSIATRLFGPGVVSLSIKVASAALSYIMLVAFARLLSPAEFGVFGFALNAAIVLSALCTLGLPLAALRFWPAHLEQGEPQFARGFAATAPQVLAVSGFVACLIGVVMLGSPWGSDALPLVIAVFAAIIAFNEFFASLLRAQGHTAWALMPRDVIWRVLAPLAAFAVLYWKGMLTGATAILACTGVLAMLTGMQWLVSKRATVRIAGSTPVQTNWPLWRATLLPLAGASVLFAMVQQLDVVVVGALLGPAEAGPYFAAQKTASLLGLVMIAGGMVAAPMMSAAFHGNRLAELRRICKYLAVGVFAATFIGLCVLALIGGKLLAIFDPSFQTAHGLLMVLALGYAIDALAGPTAYLMQMTKLENDYLKIMAMAYCIVLALQLALVPRYGAIAAAVASTLGYVVWNTFAIALLRSKVGVDASLLSFIYPPGKPAS